MRTVLLIVAALLIVLGVVFALQGIGVLGGSAMTDSLTWAVIGPVMVVVGVGIGLFARGRGARPR